MTLHNMRRETRVRTLAAHAGLWAVIGLAYSPVLSSEGRIWDDECFLDNPLLTSWRGLLTIWFHPGANTLEEHYWPVTYTVAVVVRALFGARPIVFHGLDVLWHCANASLVWILLQRFGVPLAWFAAWLFALHPIQVESVAWIVELKNLVSFFFGALGVLSFLTWERNQKKGARGRGGLVASWGLMALACLAKTAVVPLGLATGLVFWATPGGLTRQRLAFVLGSMLVSILCVGVDLWHLAERPRLVPEWDPVERVALAVQCVEHYAWKLVWPSDLCAIYPRWPVRERMLRSLAWAGAIVAAAAGAGVVAGGKGARWIRGWFAAMGASLIMLSPVLGLVAFSYQRQAFVADRFVYHAAPFFFAGVAIVLAQAFRALRWRPVAQKLVLATVLAVCAGGTFQRASLFADLRALALDTIAKNPRAWTARYFLADHLARRGKFEDALEQFAMVFWGTVEELDLRQLRSESEKLREGTSPRASFNVGLLAARSGQTERALAAFAAAQSDPTLRAQALLAQAAIQWRAQQKKQALAVLQRLYGDRAP